jgi:hypothetical protein
MPLLQPGCPSGPGSSAARTPPCRTMRSRPASGVPHRARAAAVVSSEATRTTQWVATMSLLAMSCGIGRRVPTW